MRVPFLTILALAVMLSSPCRGEAGSENVAAPQVTTTPSGSPSAQVKVSVVGVLCPTANEAARQQYDRAIDLQLHGKLGEAKDAYLRAIGSDPGYCDAMDNLGQMLRTQGDVDEAISWYQRSLKVKPDNAVAHQNLAQAYLILGERDQAVAQYQWLKENAPGNPEGFYGLGQAYLGAGRTRDAIAVLERAAELYREQASPLLVDAYYLLASAHLGQGEYRKAKGYLELTYPGREDDPDINYLLGLCYLDPADPDKVKAAQHLNKAQRLGVKVPAELLQGLDR